MATDGKPGLVVVDSVAGLQGIHKAWQVLHWHPNSDFSQYNYALRTLEGVLGPFVLGVRQDDGVQCLVVGRVERKRFEFKVGYGRLFRPRLTSIVFIYGGVLGTVGQDAADAVIGYVLQSLRRRVADLVFFNHLRTDSPLYEAIVQQAGPLSRDLFPVIQTHRAMTLPESGEAFWRRLSPKVRKNLRWQARRLLSDFTGKAVIRRFSNPADLAEMMQDVESVARTTYQRGLGAGFADSREMHERLRRNAERGWLQTHVLYLDGKPCAFWSGTLYHGTFHSDFMGYNPDYGKYSPGMYLIVSVIEELCNATGAARTVAAIDFGLGDAQYKDILGDRQWEEASICLFAPTVRGILVNAIRTPLAFLDRWAKQTLGRAGLLGRVKRTWRRSLRPS